MEHSIKQT